MTPDTITTIAALLVAFLGIWRLIEVVRRDLTNQIAAVTNQITAVNTRIDNVLLAEHRHGR